MIVEQNITYCRVLKPVTIQYLLEWFCEPMVIALDNLVTFDVGALQTIKDETWG
jgi:hypothetical protein